jgi:flagellar motor protein MotB
MLSSKILDLYKRLRLLFTPSGPGKSHKIRVIIIVAFGLFCLYSITGFLILPPYIKRVAVEKIGSQLGRQVIIESVSLNPYTLVVRVRGFEIKEEDGRTTFLSFSNLHIDLQITSIFKKGAVIRELKLDKPLVHLVRVDANSFNFSDIMDRLQSTSGAKSEEKPGKPFLFSVGNIQIFDGSIEFDDRPDATKHMITQINLSIPFISDFPSYIESFVQPSLSAMVNGTPLNIQGESKVFAESRETSLDIKFTGINIPHYLAYVPARLKVKLPSGLLDINMKAIYRQYTNRAPMIILSGETKVRNLRIAIQGSNEEFLRIPLLSVKDVTFDLETQKVEIGSIVTEGGWLAVSRSADGQMNISSLMATPPPASRRLAKMSLSKTTRLIVQLDSLHIDGYTIRAKDQSMAEPFELTVREINCKASNISTEENARGEFAMSMSIGSKGKSSTDGEFTVNPFSFGLKVRIKGFPLKPFQPFLAERAQVILANGMLNLNGDLKSHQTSTGGMNASFSGKLSVNKFSLLDKVNAEDLLKWETMYLDGIEIRNEPFFAHVKDVSLSNFYSRIIINADRTLNLHEVFTAPTPTPEAEGSQLPQTREAAVEAAEKPLHPQPTIRIDTVTLQGGTVNFTDNSIKPRFSSNLLEIGGRVTGLSSDENTMGDVELRGMYDRYAPLEITGKVNPLRNDLYIELRANFKDMDLTSASPYSGRYTGYTIQKGKLSFHLDYLVVKNKLDAKNNVLLDQFTFGDKVESPEATKLPVRFAVALLKDRNGQINLDIPVSGELNDPKFSVGRVVLKIIVNLLVKVATSPFALLSSMFGSNEQLDHADFDYGSALLNDAAKKKLDVLVKALYERPALELEIVGHADADKDREGLKQAFMLRKVKAQKVKEMAGKSGETPDLASIIVTPEEYPKYLKLAYKAEKFPKPRNFLGVAKDLPVPEMEKLMLTSQQVTEEDLKALAGERALTARDYLLQSGQVEPQRLFIVEPETLGGDKKEDVKESRVDFKLK